MTLIVKKTRIRKKTYKSKRRDFKIRSRGKSKHRKRVSIKRRNTRRNLRGGGLTPTEIQDMHYYMNKENSEKYSRVRNEDNEGFPTLKSKIEESIKTLQDKILRLIGPFMTIIGFLKSEKCRSFISINKLKIKPRTRQIIDVFYHIITKIFSLPLNYYPDQEDVVITREDFDDNIRLLKSEYETFKTSIKQDSELNKAVRNAVRFLLNVEDVYGFFSYNYYNEQGKGQEFSQIKYLIEVLDNIYDT